MSLLPSLDSSGFIVKKVLKPQKKKETKPQVNSGFRIEKSKNRCKKCAGRLYWNIREKPTKKQRRKQYYFTRWERCSECKAFWMHDEFKVVNKQKQSKKPKVEKPLHQNQYHSYINSKKWHKRRRRFFATTKQNSCAICGSREGLHLHHITYERLGMERDEDLVPLCELHHDKFHTLIGHSKKDMRHETEQFIESEIEELRQASFLKSL